MQTVHENASVCLRGPSAPEASPLQAVQHIRRMRGGAQAHLMRASDGFAYIVKFQNNPQDVRVLANEWFATRLAQKLGIPVSEPAVIEVSEWLIENTPELSCDLGGKKVPFSSGLCFGSRFIADADTGTALDYLPQCHLDRVSNLSDFARVLVLDKWTSNADGRQCIFARKPRGRKHRVTFIDFGYCFNAGEWTFPDAPLRGVYTMNRVYEGVTGWKSFEPALYRAQNISLEEIAECAAGMPSAWYRHDADGLERVIQTLYSRRSLIAELITAFCNSSRNPFPNWKD